MSNLKVGDKIRWKPGYGDDAGKIYTVRTLDGDRFTTDFGDGWKYTANGNGYEIVVEPTIDLSTAKPGDRFRLSSGVVAECTENDGSRVPALIGGYWYKPDDKPASIEHRTDLFVVEKIVETAPALDLSTAKVGDEVVSVTGLEGKIEDPQTNEPGDHEVGIRWSDGVYTATDSKSGKSWCHTNNPVYTVTSHTPAAPKIEAAKKPGILAGAKVGDKFKDVAGRVWTVSRIDEWNGTRNGEPIESWLLDSDDEHNSSWFFEEGRSNISGAIPGSQLVEKLPPVTRGGILKDAKVGDRFKRADGETVVLKEIESQDKDGVPFKVWFTDAPGADMWYRENGTVCYMKEEMTDHGTSLVEKLPPVNQLAVGTYIKFKRNSRSGRYKKGQVAKVADHGPKSMVVHVHSFGKGFDSDTPVFLPHERDDIYEVVEPVHISKCKWMDLVIPTTEFSAGWRWFAVSYCTDKPNTLLRGHPKDGSNGHTVSFDGRVIVLGSMKTYPYAG